MKIRAGLWIDHAKAVVVALTEGGVKTLSITSKAEKPFGPVKVSVGKKQSLGISQLPADDSLQRRETGQLNIFYEAVIAGLRNAREILVLGPGEAKLEMKKRMERDGLGERIVAVETSGRLTDRQVSAKIQKYFREQRGKQAPKVFPGRSSQKRRLPREVHGVDRFRYSQELN